MHQFTPSPLPLELDGEALEAPAYCLEMSTAVRWLRNLQRTEQSPVARGSFCEAMHLYHNGHEEKVIVRSLLPVACAGGNM